MKQVLSLKWKKITGTYQELKKKKKPVNCRTLRSEYFSLIKPWISQDSKSFNYSKDCMELIERSQSISWLGTGNLKDTSK